MNQRYDVRTKIIKLSEESTKPSQEWIQECFLGYDNKYS